MSEKNKTTVKTEKAQSIPSKSDFVFGRENYILMIVGIVVIAIGFVLMSGKEDILNSTKLTVAPIVVVIGFLIEAVAVMYKSKD